MTLTEAAKIVQDAGYTISKRLDVIDQHNADFLEGIVEGRAQVQAEMERWWGKKLAEAESEVERLRTQAVVTAVEIERLRAGQDWQRGEIKRLRAINAELVTALRSLAFRSNNDWPRSMTCLVCGGSFSINDTGYENHESGCCAAIAKVGGA